MWGEVRGTNRNGPGRDVDDQRPALAIEHQSALRRDRDRDRVRGGSLFGSHGTFDDLELEQPSGEDGEEKDGDDAEGHEPCPEPWRLGMLEGGAHR